MLQEVYCVVDQPKSTAIDKERSDRVQAVSEVHVQLAELLNEFPTFVSTSGCRVRDSLHEDARTDEIVIGGFGLKSKDGAIVMVEKVITGADGNPQIFYDRISMVPKVYL